MINANGDSGQVEEMLYFTQKRRKKGDAINILLTRIVFLAILVINFLVCSKQEQKGQNQLASEFYIRYYFTAECAYHKIDISQAKLIYTYFEDVSGKCNRWEANVACWTEEELKTKEVVLTKKEIDSLISLINQTNFMALDTSIGRTDRWGRYYPYELSVKIGKQDKRVVYYSGLVLIRCPKHLKKSEKHYLSS